MDNLKYSRDGGTMQEVGEDGQRAASVGGAA